MLLRVVVVTEPFLTLYGLNFFHEKKSAGKKKKKNQYTYPNSNPQPPALEFNALPTWPLHHIKNSRKL